MMITLCESQAKELFCDEIDRCIEPYKIWGMSFHASDVLKECDPIGFRSYLLDFCSDRGIELDDDAAYIHDLGSILDINDDGDFVYKTGVA